MLLRPHPLRPLRRAGIPWRRWLRPPLPQGSGTSAPPATATRPIPHDAGNVLPADLTEYREQVLRLREEYAGRMEVLLGIEQDSQSVQPVPDWADYWIGSVHNLYDPKTGKYHGVDWDRERLTACRDEMFGGDAAGRDGGLLPGCGRHGGPKTRHSGPH